MEILKLKYSSISIKGSYQHCPALSEFQRLIVHPDLDSTETTYIFILFTAVIVALPLCVIYILIILVVNPVWLIPAFVVNALYVDVLKVYRQVGGLDQDVRVLAFKFVPNLVKGSVPRDFINGAVTEI